MTHSIFRSVFVSSLLLLASTGLAAKSRSQTAITVGSASIRESQIDSIVDLMAKAQEANGPITDAQRQAMRQLAATELVTQSLLELEAKAQHLQATPREVDSIFKAFKAQFPSDAVFKETLKKAGDTEARVKIKLARQIRLDKALSTRMKKPLPPTEKEMRDFWQEYKSKFPINDSLRALQIVLLVDNSTPAAEAEGKRKALESLRAELLQDTAQTPVLLREFMGEAARVSEGPEGRSGGDLQRFDPKDFNPEFRKHVQSLRVGQLSPVFKTPLGFHLVLLIEKYDGKYESYKLQILQSLVHQKTQEASEQMRGALKSLAAKYPVKYLNSAYKDATESGIY